MTLNVIGNVSRYYAETLCLLFFPGSKFPEDGTGGEPVVTLRLTDGDIPAGYAEISCGGRTEHAEYTPSRETAARQGKNMTAQIAVGGAMLRAGEKFCGITPPWGALTGVRPTKLVLRKGENAEEMLREDFLTSPEKARLAVMTADAEQKFITDEARGKCSVYIAIPFCPTKCTYCSFTSFSSPKLLSMIPAYLERLTEDIRDTFEIIRQLGLTVETVYIGGGTPTTLNEKELSHLLSVIGECCDTGALAEFTLEAGRPDTITAEKMRLAKELGVTRVSVNAQTMNAEILEKIGRRHTPEDFLRAYAVARESGIRDINVDLIAGLPGESPESFLSSSDKIVALDPENITVHTFYVKRAAVLAGENTSYRAEDAVTVRSLGKSQEMKLSAGYIPYYLYRQKNTAANLENTGFAKPGHECAYNIYMMEEIHTVFGAGASSMTKFVSRDGGTIRRMSETKYPYEYLDPGKSTAKVRREELFRAAREFYGKDF